MLGILAVQVVLLMSYVLNTVPLSVKRDFRLNGIFLAAKMDPDYPKFTVVQLMLSTYTEIAEK